MVAEVQTLLFSYIIKPGTYCNAYVLPNGSYHYMTSGLQQFPVRDLAGGAGRSEDRYKTWYSYIHNGLDSLYYVGK